MDQNAWNLYRYGESNDRNRVMAAAARAEYRLPYRTRSGILKALVKVLLAFAVSAIALGAFEEGLVPHLVACFSGCYFVHFLSHAWSLIKGRSHHHDGC